MKCSHPGCGEMANIKAPSPEAKKWCNAHRNWKGITDEEKGEWINDPDDQKLVEQGFEFLDRGKEKRKKKKPKHVPVVRKAAPELPEGTFAKKSSKVEESEDSDEEYLGEPSVVRSADDGDEDGEE